MSRDTHATIAHSSGSIFFGECDGTFVFGPYGAAAGGEREMVKTGGGGGERSGDQGGKSVFVLAGRGEGCAGGKWAMAGGAGKAVARGAALSEKNAAWTPRLSGGGECGRTVANNFTIALQSIDININIG